MCIDEPIPMRQQDEGDLLCTSRWRISMSVVSSAIHVLDGDVGGGSGRQPGRQSITEL